MTDQRPIKSPREIAPLVLPAWTYRNAELNELEYEALFRPSWQFACHVNQVKNVGYFVTLDLLRDSIVVLRGKDSELRAFMNVCRHRGAKLLDGAGTCKARVTCPYHGWSYNLRGELAGMPAEKTFPGGGKKQPRAPPVAPRQPGRAALPRGRQEPARAPPGRARDPRRPRFRAHRPRRRALARHVEGLH